MLNKTTISIVIPVYNSEKTLPELLSRLEVVLQEISHNFEVILVNDGSQDNSWNIIGQLSQKYSWMLGINLMRNYGQHNSLLCGIRAAKNEIIVTLDDDLQNPPEEIPKLIDKLDEGYDVVYGMPQKQQHGFLRNMASLITRFTLQTAMGAETARKISAFRAFRSRLKVVFVDYQSPTVSIDALLTWGTKHFGAVTVNHVHRQNGESNYTFRMLLAYALNLMTAFSTLPLQLSIIIGLFLILLGALILPYGLCQYFSMKSVPGFFILVSIIVIFSGAQLIALGVMGEYLARMHSRLMAKPGSFSGTSQK